MDRNLYLPVAIRTLYILINISGPYIKIRKNWYWQKCVFTRCYQDWFWNQGWVGDSPVVRVLSFFYFIFNVKFICIKIKFQRPSHNDFISNLDVRFIGIKIKFQWPSHWFVADQCLPSRRLRCHPSLPGHTFLCHLLQVTNTLISLSLSLSWYIFTICLNYKHFDFFIFVFILVWTHLFYTIYYRFPNFVLVWSSSFKLKTDFHNAKTKTYSSIIFLTFQNFCKFSLTMWW